MFEIPKKIEFIIDRLSQNGHTAYIVGGCVRDLLLGLVPSDFDVTTSATPQEITAIFEKTIPTGIKHGTVTVLVENTPVEVTTFRTEGGYTDNRRPDNVQFVKNLREDLSRRDFTVNAIAYNKKDSLKDYFGGKCDLENKILRAVGDPEARFREDALRILRLFRFASTLGFQIEKETLSAALKCANLIENVSRERIFTELKKAVSGENFETFAPLIQSGGLKFLNIAKTPDFEKMKTASPMLRLYMFLNYESLEKLNPSNKEKVYFEQMDCALKMPIPKAEEDIKNMRAVISDNVLADYFVLKNLDDHLLKNVLEKNEPYLISDLALNGQDLLMLGYKGEKIGEILKILQKFVIKNPESNNKQDLLNQIP